jgi:hypothetical protein
LIYKRGVIIYLVKEMLRKDAKKCPRLLSALRLCVKK